jgi:hypothetical protein
LPHSLELFVEFPDDGTYRLGKVAITGRKIVSVSVSTWDGEHVTYPADGRVHRTRPGVSRDFSSAHPALSAVTFDVFDVMEVGSSGPPAGAVLAHPSTGAFCVKAPSCGTAKLFAAVVDSTEAERVAAYLDGLSSNSTYQVTRGASGVALLGWDEAGIFP